MHICAVVVLGEGFRKIERLRLIIITYQDNRNQLIRICILECNFLLQALVLLYKTRPAEDFESRTKLRKGIGSKAKGCREPRNNLRVLLEISDVRHDLKAFKIVRGDTNDYLINAYQVQTARHFLSS